MFRTLPPTAVPLRLRDILLALKSAFWDSDPEGEFCEKICRYFGVKYTFLVSSGKAAIYLCLHALSELSARREVIIPAYASYCLASAVAKSGLAVRLCDVNPATLDFDFDRLRHLITEKTLAVIAVHNYGLVCDLEKTRELAAQEGASVIEDAAQAAGATYRSLKAGTVGHAGILSLGRGKNICALGGGVILTDDSLLADQLGPMIESRPRPSSSESSKGIVIALGLSLFLNPERYALPAHVPFLRLGANIFDPSYRVTRLPPVNSGLGRLMLDCLDTFNAMRVKNAASLHRLLSPTERFTVPRTLPQADSVYLRFPVLLEDRQMRDRAFRELTKRRLGASTSYPAPLDEIPGFRQYLLSSNGLLGARAVASRILTLPTHPYLRESDLRAIASTMERFN